MSSGQGQVRHVSAKDNRKSRPDNAFGITHSPVDIFPAIKKFVLAGALHADRYRRSRPHMTASRIDAAPHAKR